MAQHDQHGKSNGRRVGNAKPREVHEDGSIQEQTSELPDGALGSDDVCCTGEQWDQHEESFEQDEEDVQFDGDEEVQRLIESESEALSHRRTGH